MERQIKRDARRKRIHIYIYIYIYLHYIHTHIYVYNASKSICMCPLCMNDQLVTRQDPGADRARGAAHG